MKSEITAREFLAWRAYYALEPFGEERADLRAGIVAAAMRNSMRTKGRCFQAEDFMPKFGQRRMDDETIANRIETYFRAFGAQLTRKKNKEV